MSGAKSSQSADELCLPTCKHDRKLKKGNKTLPMISCCCCMTWFHEECVSAKNDNATIWNCASCRTMPTQVFNLHDTVKSLHDLVLHLTDSVKQLLEANSASTAKLAAMETTMHTLKTENENLRKICLGKTFSSAVTLQPDADKEKHLLLGDSLLRSVDPRKLKATEVVCISGGKTTDALQRLSDMETDFKSVTICIGTNDCSSASFNAEETSTTYKELVQTAITKTTDSSKVTLSSIPPRMDNPENQDRVVLMNAGICSIASETGCSFSNNDACFSLADGSPNDGYLCRDGLHLNSAGTNKLLKALKVRTTAENATKDYKPRSASTPSSRRNTATPTTTTRGCYFCGERNHTKEQCRHERPVTCSSCGRKGHKAKFCKQA